MQEAGRNFWKKRINMGHNSVTAGRLGPALEKEL
jgi:hypothetical protein